jgi:peptidoglycan/xylan/chitin deacetylase (PgdA/CDA1 family)
LPSGTLVVPLHALPSREWFVRFIQVLGRHYRFVSGPDVESMLHGGPALDGCCHLTFDDGHETFSRLAMPVLIEANIPVTLFVSPLAIRERQNYWFQELGILEERLGEDAVRRTICEIFGCHLEQIEPFSITLLALCMTRDDVQRVIDRLKQRSGLTIDQRFNMTADELRDVARSPLVSVGAHTMRHPVLANETDACARVEIEQSIDELSELIGRRMTMFAYPNGTEGLDFTAREQRVLGNAGIRVAMTTDAGGCFPQTNPLAVPRGGYPSLGDESTVRMTMRVLWPGLYERLRRITGRSDVSGTEQRRAIYALGIFPTAHAAKN